MPGQSIRPGTLVPHRLIPFPPRPALAEPVARHRAGTARGIHHPLDAAAHDGDPPVRSAEWRQPAGPRDLGLARCGDSRGIHAASAHLEARSQPARYVPHTGCEARSRAAPRTSEAGRGAGTCDLPGCATRERTEGGGSPLARGCSASTAAGTRPRTAAGNSARAAARRAREGGNADRDSSADGSGCRTGATPGAASTAAAARADHAAGFADAAA